MFENQFLQAGAIIVVFWLASYVVTFLLSILEKATSKTDSSLDDRILQAVKLPIRYLAVLLGFYFAVRQTAISWEYEKFSTADLFYVLIVLLLGFSSSRIFKVFFDWYGDEASETKKINKTMFVFLRKVVSVAVYIVALVFIFGHLGIEIGPLIAGLGVAGLAIALGLQETLANLFAALFLVMDKSINIGDYIQLEDGTKAYIDDISWRSVRIRTIGGNTIIVPNATFVGQKISSYDYPASPMTTSIAVGVSYDSDLDKVEYIAKQAGEAVIQEEGINVEDNNPIIRYTELADSSINFAIYIKIDNVVDEGRVKHSLIKKIVSEFRKEEIEIPYPHRVVVDA